MDRVSLKHIPHLVCIFLRKRVRVNVRVIPRVKKFGCGATVEAKNVRERWYPCLWKLGLGDGCTTADKKSI